ncbi:hypothetical protein RRG08_048806 [Elysia crispata]|uniref:C2H2-type domain-containing protein n=1 Tax=Elysia crispata TaxID=231223 RepID=A0AAE1B3Q2_9GAST|nr:hypothetical protein RRG08_048806 [Elysia crispata]
MDYDSSTKFISSLAKFLQSLCNGYVEFDNGVQVIGHLYLNVDTGKTIDYVLNEKVCKTDENSVTFISNSFHAQPAEKPKPPGKRPDNDPDKNELKAEVETNQTELRGSNAGSLSSSRNQGSNSSLAGTKRPLSPSKKDSMKSGHASPRNKRNRQDFDVGNSTLSMSESIESSPADIYQQSLSSHEASSFSESYQQNFFAGDENSVGDGQEQRDIKPTFDTDITFIKEEYAPSSGLQSENQAIQDDGSQADNSSGYSHSYPNQQFHSGGYAGQGNFNPNQRSTFNPAGYNSGNSQMEGSDVSNDPSVGKWCRSGWGPSQGQNSGSGFVSPEVLLQGGNFNMAFTEEPATFTIPVNDNLHRNRTKRWADRARRFLCHECKKCGFVSRDPFLMANHKRTCNGKRHLTCPVCSKVLSRYDALAEHLRGIHGIGDKVGCKYCGKSFKYRPQMYQHQSVCHLKPSKSNSRTGSLLESGAADMKLTFPYDVCGSPSAGSGTLAKNEVHF